MTSAAPPLLIAAGLQKRYGRQLAVDALSLAIGPGQVVGLVGLNGAGKSTTLQMLAGLSRPSAGQVWLAGVPLWPHGHRQRARIGYLPERPPLEPDLGVAAFLRLAYRLRGGSRRWADARVAEVLARVELGGVAAAPIATLSHGTRARVGLAQALVHRPPLVLLDEPTSGLDVVQVGTLKRVLGRLGGEVAVVLSSHHMGVVAALCDRLWVMHEGRLVVAASTAELASDGELRVEVGGSLAPLARAVAQVAGVRWTAGGVGPDAHAWATLTGPPTARAPLARAVTAAGLDLVGLSWGPASLAQLLAAPRRRLPAAPS